MRASLLIISLLVLVLAGCSRGDTETASDTTNSSEADTTASTEQTTVIAYKDPGAVTDPESFLNDADPKLFNAILTDRPDIKTPESLIKLYYNFPDEGLETSRIIVDSLEIDNNNFLITLIHDGLMDDSLLGIKVVMSAWIDRGIWTVTEVKRNWRCREGRGHTKWGIENCS